MPPYYKTNHFYRALFTKKYYGHVTEPAIADAEQEYFEVLDRYNGNANKWACRWAHLRGNLLVAWASILGKGFEYFERLFRLVEQLSKLSK